jgi:hypothetical protein
MQPDNHLIAVTCPSRLRRLACVLAFFLAVSPGLALAQSGAGRSASAITNLLHIKTPLSGFVSMGDDTLGPGEIVDNSLKWILAEPGVFSGVVVNISWTQIEGKPNNFNTSAIDSALQAVAAYNARNRTAPLGIRLNVESGLLAPGWAKNLDGPPVEIADIPNGTSPPIIFTIGRFWEPDYRLAWRDLQDMLASRYDANPLIHEVTIGSCASVTDEPFVLITKPFAIRNMHRAGFTDQEYYDCLSDSPADYAAWKQSLIHYPFNPFLRTDSGVPISDEATTANLIDKWRSALGDRAVLANHGLVARPGSPEFPQIARMYKLFLKLGPPIDLQTWSAKQDWPNSIGYGIAVGATDIELWPGYAAGEIQATIPKAELELWSAKLQANLAAGK